MPFTSTTTPASPLPDTVEASGAAGTQRIVDGASSGKTDLLDEIDRALEHARAKEDAGLLPDADARGQARTFLGAAMQQFGGNLPAAEVDVDEDELIIEWRSGNCLVSLTCSSLDPASPRILYGRTNEVRTDAYRSITRARPDQLIDQLRKLDGVEAGRSC